MEKKRAIPEDFMTVGELAKRMGTTVRTLQYYDKEGVLSSSAASEGGRRLYTHKDMIKLHQIQSLKSLGFSLKDIKNKLVSLDTPAEVANVLTRQAQDIREEIERLTETLTEVEVLKTEVLQMQKVNFKKYADIIINLQMNNEYYWLIKHFDDEILDHIRKVFNKETGIQFMSRFNQLNDKILELQKKNIPPEDEQAQILAKEFWNMLMEFTNGDMSMFQKLMEFGISMMDDNNEWANRQTGISTYLQPALEVYFQNSGIDPFGGAQL